MSRVDIMSPENYAETGIGEVVVVGNRLLKGTHSYSSTSRFEAVDVWGNVGDVEDFDLEWRVTSSETAAT